MLKKYNNLEKIIISIFVTSILIDNINGALMLYLGTSLVTFGQVIRIFFVLFFAYLIIKNLKIDIKKQWSYLMGMSCLVILLPLYFFIRHGSIKGLYMDALYGVKLLFPILIITAMKLIINKDKVSKNIVEDIFKIYSVLVPLTLIIPMILGIGFSSYELGGGYKGFYYSNNEINVVLICTFIYCVDKLFKNKCLKNLFLVVINLFALLAIGSKTSIIVFVIVLLAYLIKIMKKCPRKAIMYFIITIFILGISVIIFKGFFSEMFERIHYYYIHFKNSGGNFLDFITSGRSDRIYPAFQKNVLDSKMGILNLLFGIGRYSQIDNYDLASLMEMDFFDVMNWYGIITALIITIIYISNFIKSIRHNKKFDFKLMFVLVTLFSLIAGHVWFSALAGSALALVCVALNQEGCE